MSLPTPLDCLVIGYYEPPFQAYESLIANYGRRSTAYRDLQFSFVDLAGTKMNYVDLLNYTYRLAHPEAAAGERGGPVFLSGDIPNLAAVYLTNFLTGLGFRADYINLFEYEKDALAAHLERGPACVAITTTFYVLPVPVIEIVSAIRAINPDVPIVVGGPLIGNYSRGQRLGSATPEEQELFAALCEDMGADIYVIESQGELTLARTIQCLKEHGSLERVPNIAYMDGGRLRMTRSEPENNALDQNIIRWSEFDAARLGRTIQTRTARSCAFNCAFCNYPTRAGKLALASLGAIEQELDAIRALGTVRNVVFIDDTFNVPLPRFKDICRLMIRKQYGFGWYSYFRCSNSDEEALDLMAESGCRGVFLGIESGSPTILKNMNKAATIEKYAAGIRMLHERRILTFGSFIVGFPGETAETVQETIDFVTSHPLDYYRAQLWYCEPGTPIHGQREKYGIEGEGFVWQHKTLDSTAGMDHIERMFRQVTNAAWLPQWSFDFWIISYLMGRGITEAQFKEFMRGATALLRLEIEGIEGPTKASRQAAVLVSLVDGMRGWRVDGAGRASPALAVGEALGRSM